MMQCSRLLDHKRTGSNLELNLAIGAKGDDRDDVEMRSGKSRTAL